MTEISTSRLRDTLARTIGPTPWYWKAFPQVSSASGQRFAWTHHGSEGPLGYVISLGSSTGAGQTASGLEYILPPVLRSAFAPWHLVPGGAEHSSRVLRS